MLLRNFLPCRAAHNDGKFTYSIDGHSFMFLSNGGVTFLCVADEAYGRAIPSEFLNRMCTEFQTKYSDKASAAAEGSLNSTFGKQLKAMIEHATQVPGEYDKAVGVAAKVDAVKLTMIDNIGRIIEREKKLTDIEGKTEELVSESERFLKTGRAIGRQLWWQNWKMKIIMTGAVLLVVAVVVLMICLSAKCFGH